MRKYVDKGNLDEVNYLNFCKDVDEVLIEDVKISTTHANAFKTKPEIKLERVTYILNDKPDCLDDVIAKLRKKYYF